MKGQIEIADHPMTLAEQVRQHRAELDRRAREWGAAFESKFYGKRGLPRGETDPPGWLAEAKRSHAAFVKSLDSVDRRLASADQLDYFRAFHDDYLERYPDMEPSDRDSLNQFLERAEKRLRRPR